MIFSAIQQEFLQQFPLEYFKNVFLPMFFLRISPTITCSDTAWMDPLGIYQEFLWRFLHRFLQVELFRKFLQGLLQKLADVLRFSSKSSEGIAPGMLEFLPGDLFGLSPRILLEIAQKIIPEFRPGVPLWILILIYFLKYVTPWQFSFPSICDSSRDYFLLEFLKRFFQVWLHVFRSSLSKQFFWKLL